MLDRNGASVFVKFCLLGIFGIAEFQSVHAGECDGPYNLPKWEDYVFKDVLAVLDMCHDSPNTPGGDFFTDCLHSTVIDDLSISCLDCFDFELFLKKIVCQSECAGEANPYTNPGATCEACLRGFESYVRVQFNDCSGVNLYSCSECVTHAPTQFPSFSPATQGPSSSSTSDTPSFSPSGNPSEDSITEDDVYGQEGSTDPKKGSINMVAIAGGAGAASLFFLAVAALMLRKTQLIHNDFKKTAFRTDEAIPSAVVVRDNDTSFVISKPEFEQNDVVAVVFEGDSGDEEEDA